MSYSIPYTMIPGTKARAQEVNANFKYVTDSLDELSGAKMNATLSNLTVDGIEVIKNLTCFRNIGEIISSAIPLTDAGLHLLDGALISGSGTYSDFVDYIADLYETDPTADYFTTEADWQTAVTTYGVCGKFVYDSVNDTVRLPKITGIVEGTTDLTALGDLVEAGLPNITGEVQPHYNSLRLGTYNGYGNFDTPGTAAWGSGAFGNSTNTGGISFDASLSNAIYGNSSTVQPQTIKVLYYIVVATSSKTDIQVDIDEIATDLNGKADTDLSNVPTSKGILSESYVNGTSWYRVYSDGWCEQGGVSTASEYSRTITFLKAFTNTNYGGVAINQTGNNTSTYANMFIPVTTSTATIYSFASSSTKVYWQACGYIR